MKVRKLAVALALIGSLGTGTALALGLGEVNLRSHLNEPLNAEIGLTSIGALTTDEIFVNLASPQDFERAGLTRTQSLSNVKFTVLRNARGQLSIDVSSRQAIREPYLSFLLEVTWPKGRMLREYSLLLDPPVFGGQQAAEPIAAPSVAPVSRPLKPATASQAGTAAAAPSPSSASRNLPPRAAIQDGQYGPVKSNDTLWNIAQQANPGGASSQQVMLAIQDLNADAFIDNNINKLKRGKILRLPTAEQIQSRTITEARQQVAAQNRAFGNKAAPAPLNATDAQVAGQKPSAPVAAGDELKLVVDAGDAAKGSHGGGTGGAGEQNRLALTLEQLDKASRENQELKERVKDLEQQTETQKRLIQLKDDALAKVQQATQQPVPETTAVPAPETAAAESVPTTEAIQTAPQPDTATTETAPDATKETTAAAEPATTPAETAAPTETTAAAPAVPEKAAKPAAPGQSTSANFFEELSQNPLYQVIAGGGALLLLLLLWLLARRSAHREHHFYQQLRSETGDDADSQDALLGSDLESVDEMDDKSGEDPLAEAEVYIAYGRLDQAEHLLEGAISKEPSRSDLRLKLLEVYAAGGQTAAFEKQVRELSALDEEEADSQVNALRQQLQLNEENEGPSIDDLENALKTDTSLDALTRQTQATQREMPEMPEDDLSFDELPDVSDTASDQAESPAEEVQSVELETIDWDFEPVDEDVTPEAEAQQAAASAGDSSFALEDEMPESLDFSAEDEVKDQLSEEISDADLDVNFDLDADAFGAEEKPYTELAAEEGAEIEKELTLDDLDELPKDFDPENAQLDESFLEDLDAELEKDLDLSKTAATPVDAGTALDDLELDVSEDDLAMMESVASESDHELDLGSLDLDDTEEVAATTTDAEPEPMSLNEAQPLVSEDDTAANDHEDLDLLTDEDLDRAGEALAHFGEEGAIDEAGAAGNAPAGEASFDEDQDFDFLAATDEAATKLDLARAYIDMGDAEGARDILEEVAIEGSDAQKAEASTLLKSIQS